MFGFQLGKWDPKIDMEWNMSQNEASNERKNLVGLSFNHPFWGPTRVIPKFGCCTSKNRSLQGEGCLAMVVCWSAGPLQPHTKYPRPYPRNCFVPSICIPVIVIFGDHQHLASPSALCRHSSGSWSFSSHEYPWNWSWIPWWSSTLQKNARCRQNQLIVSTWYTHIIIHYIIVFLAHLSLYMVWCTFSARVDSPLLP